MDFRDQSQTIGSLAAMTLWTNQVTITGSGEPEEASFSSITPNLFSTLGVQPVMGGTFTIDELPEDGVAQAVLSHGFWQRWFGGDTEVVGKTLVMNGQAVEVMGVMPPRFRLMNDADFWVPPWPGNSDPITRRYHNWLLVGRLAEGATLEEARTEVDLISTQLQNAYPDSNRDKALQIDDLQSAMVDGYRQSLLLLMGAIVLVLLIACSNVASLLMARGTARSGEMAIRSSLGAGQGRLARQLLVECVVLALAAGALGIFLAAWLQKLVLRLIPMDMLDMGEIGISATMLVAALALSLATVLFFGVFPSVAAARSNPAEELKEGTRTSGGRTGTRLRSMLVVFQVAVSLVLLVGAGLLMRSFGALRGVDTGYRVENVLTGAVSLPADRYPGAPEVTQFFRTLKESLENLPGVQSVGLVDRLPILQAGGNVAIWVPERPPETNRDAPWADRRVVMPGYFETMEIPLLQGRAFQDSDNADAPAVIILAQSTVDAVFEDENPLGRQVAVDMGSDAPGLFQVIGVVEDHRNSSVQNQGRPAMFFPYAQMPTRTMRLTVVTEGNPNALVRPIQERIWEGDRDLVFSTPQTMEDVVSQNIGSTRAITLVLGVFAVVALGLAALGLYGVLAFLVSKQAREIGIRMALGASGGRVLRLVISRGMILVALGTTLGLAGAWGGAGFVEDLLFQTNARDPATYAGVTAFFCLVALGACLLPGWRAVQVNPVESFRTE
jgi:putative ABC transport system permease protein